MTVSFVVIMIIPSLVFIDALLTDRLIHLGMTESQAGLGFTIYGFFYGVGSPITGALCQKWDRRFVIMIHLGLSVIACFLCGPSKLLGFSEEIWIIFTGLSILGLNIAVFVPAVPEMIYAMQV